VMVLVSSPVTLGVYTSCKSMCGLQWVSATDPGGAVLQIFNPEHRARAKSPKAGREYDQFCIPQPRGVPMLSYSVDIAMMAYVHLSSSQRYRGLDDEGVA
jgi:hypothetical protein